MASVLDPGQGIGQMIPPSFEGTGEIEREREREREREKKKRAKECEKKKCGKVRGNGKIYSFLFLVFLRCVGDTAWAGMSISIPPWVENGFVPNQQYPDRCRLLHRRKLVGQAREHLSEGEMDLRADLLFEFHFVRFLVWHIGDMELQYFWILCYAVFECL
jgi:hypothetical protein